MRPLSRPRDDPITGVRAYRTAGERLGPYVADAGHRWRSWRASIGTSLPQGRYLSALVSWTVSSRIGSRGPDADQDQDVARLDRSLPTPFTASMASRSATNTFAEETLTGSTSKL
ncbi:MAG: hypothetical protein OXM87_08935, partial [Truepera sp.]|nr:hypothetical protein [Truepera sp.]